MCIVSANYAKCPLVCTIFPNYTPVNICVHSVYELEHSIYMYACTHTRIRIRICIRIHIYTACQPYPNTPHPTCPHSWGPKCLKGPNHSTS